VHEAKRRGVEAIVLAAEEPTRLRGGLRYGGKQGLRDTFVGETTRYVVQKAPSRVILTAPPAHRGVGTGDGKPVQDPATVADERAPVSLGHPATVAVDADSSR
jgi:APA family basic amino acid/polyamine antiporter